MFLRVCLYACVFVRECVWRHSEIEYQRATVTTVTVKESDREGKSDSERGGGCLSRVRTEIESGRETERDTQRRRQKDLLPFFAVTVSPCIRVFS